MFIVVRTRRKCARYNAKFSNARGSGYGMTCDLGLRSDKVCSPSHRRGEMQFRGPTVMDIFGVLIETLTGNSQDIHGPTDVLFDV